MKVFSEYKFLCCCLEDGDSDEEILEWLNGWACDCEGLTESEIDVFGIYNLR